MPTQISAELKGLKETQRNLEKAAQDLRGTPMLNAMRDATLTVDRDAMKNAPVDTGRLHASITPAVSVIGETIQGIVGSDVSYAPYVELGTRPHWPPRAALEVWARRHHMNVFLVQRSIGLFGTPAREYLQRAFRDNKGKIEARFNKAVEQIAKDANK